MWAAVRGVAAFCGDIVELVLGEVGEVCGVGGGHCGGVLWKCWKVRCVGFVVS